MPPSSGRKPWAGCLLPHEAGSCRMSLLADKFRITSYNKEEIFGNHSRNEWECEWRRKFLWSMSAELI